jgi:MFS family permease
MERSRWPAAAAFLLAGLIFGTYLMRLPTFKVEYGLSDGQVGSIGLAFAVTAMLTLQLVGQLVTRAGPEPVLRAGLVVLPLGVAGVGLARGVAAYVVASVLLAVAIGTLDAAMNTYAVAVEQDSGRPLLSTCHGAWSVAAVVATLGGGALVAAGVPVSVHLVAVAAVGVVAGVLVGARVAPAPVAAQERTSWRAGWSRPVVRLGLAGTVLMIGDAAALGWSGILLHDHRGATLSVAAGGVVAFTACQAAGRLVGDRLRSAYGDRRLFRAGGLVGAAGVAVALALPGAAATIAGFGLLGLGTATLIPIAYGAAGRLDSGAAVARFTTFVYAGILVEPAAIGWVANVIGLPATISLLAPLLVLAATLTRIPAPGQPAPRQTVPAAPPAR